MCPNFLEGGLLRLLFVRELLLTLRGWCEASGRGGAVFFISSLISVGFLSL